MNKRELPIFKYHPDPVASRSFVKETIICEVCNEESEYKYAGSFYSVDEVECICPWCIKDGSAAKKFDGDFLDYIDYEGIDRNINKEELFYRTPGYEGLQSEKWLGHCGDFCSYHGYLNGNDLNRIYTDPIREQNELFEVINEYFEGKGYNWEVIIKAGDFFRVYLFKCLTCGIQKVYANSW